MNRKTFLASIAAVIAAPFVVKAKPQPKQKEDDLIRIGQYDYIKRSEFKAMIDRYNLAHPHRIHFDPKFTINGNDLVAVIDRKNP